MGKCLPCLERVIMTGITRVSEESYNLFVKALLREELEEMVAYMNKAALTIFSYFDIRKEICAGSCGKREY